MLISQFLTFFSRVIGFEYDTPSRSDLAQDDEDMQHEDLVPHTDKTPV